MIFIIFKYLIAKVGVNVQKGQNVVIFAEVDQSELVSYVMEECFKLGARDVCVEWSCSLTRKVAYKKEKVNDLAYIPDWVIEKQKYYNKTLPAFIYIDSDDPDGLKGINQKKMRDVHMKTYPILKPLRDERENKYQSQALKQKEMHI